MYYESLYLYFYLSYSERKSHLLCAVFILICCLSAFTIYSHIRHNQDDCQKHIEHEMFVLIFSTTFDWNISHSGKNLTKYCQKFNSVCFQRTPYSCQMLINLELSQKIFEKCSNIKFHKNASCGNRVLPCGQIDERTKHDETNSRFSELCERV
jgi:hypothetical protein